MARLPAPTHLTNCAGATYVDPFILHQMSKVRPEPVRRVEEATARVPVKPLVGSHLARGSVPFVQFVA